MAGVEGGVAVVEDVLHVVPEGGDEVKELVFEMVEDAVGEFDGVDGRRVDAGLIAHGAHYMGKHPEAHIWLGVGVDRRTMEESGKVDADREVIERPRAQVLARTEVDKLMRRVVGKIDSHRRIIAEYHGVDIKQLDYVVPFSRRRDVEACARHKIVDPAVEVVAVEVAVDDAGTVTDRPVDLLRIVEDMVEKGDWEKVVGMDVKAVSTAQTVAEIYFDGFVVKGCHNSIFNDITLQI